MNYSLQVGNDSADWATLKAIAEAADAGSWSTIWNFDHLVPPLAELMPHLSDDRARSESGDCLEAYTILAAWAAITKRVRIGSLVTAIPFRNPAILAKEAVTVDHISGGRLEFGVGAAWHTGEARAYNIQLGTPKERLDRFEEALQVFRQLFDRSQTSRNFSGSYYKLDSAPFAPQPVQKKLPLTIGGGGEKRTLKLVAQYADVYNFFGNTICGKDEYVHKNRVLDEHCATVGRDPKEIKRSLALFADIELDDAKARARVDFMTNKNGFDVFIGSPQRIVDSAAQFADLDLHEIIFCGLTPTAEAIARFDEEVLRQLPR